MALLEAIYSSFRAGSQMRFQVHFFLNVSECWCSGLGRQFAGPCRKSTSGKTAVSLPWAPRTRPTNRPGGIKLNRSRCSIMSIHLLACTAPRSHHVMLRSLRLYRLQRREAANRPDDAGVEQQLRLPRSVQAAYLRPLRRQAKYGIPTCDLQMRSFSVRNLEFFADFALRAAYYLNLAAHGPVPLPKKVERWTVPRSSFVYKKSQENFERITLRRLIQIRDGHPETIETWLAFLKKHAYYGVGMKANIWEFEKLGRFVAQSFAGEDLTGI